MFTRPNEIVPFQMERMDYSVSQMGVYVLRVQRDLQVRRTKSAEVIAPAAVSIAAE